jgi:predicted RNA binding protein YcfA (HicA-like mRNA interferase family)
VAKKVYEVVAIIELHGWELTRTRGSHRQFRHPRSYAAVITISGKRSSTMTVGQLASIRRLSGIKELR